MHINSTEFLGLVTKNNCYILFEKGVPSGRIKRDFISLTTQDGRALALSTPQGFQSCPVELPRAIFDDFLVAGLIEQDGLEDSEGRVVFRLTSDGYARAAT
ncbi:hypothetical protein [Methylocystis sp. SB2]|uniref:hypothetical protein n=1 Tax=Methylocystis sp. (strain SB2) TaxID=743836 RepID=UPI0004011CDC|nr:hypothetical protein [Methylocystis sp. SB2]ULO25091.1 hypothetical protein LNB28_06800 [Methylocystis sp. SB2]